MLSEYNNNKRLSTMWFHLHEKSKGVRFKEIVVIVRAGEKEK